MIRKPPRLFVLLLLFWQVATSMGVTVAHGAAPLEQRGPAALTAHRDHAVTATSSASAAISSASAATSSASASADCPDHVAAAAGAQGLSSNHSSKHDCCGSVSACHCVTAGILSAPPLLPVRAFATPLPLLAYAGAVTAPIVPFFRPPIA